MRRLIILLSTMAAALFGMVALTTPAFADHGSDGTIFVCNSSGSTAPIDVYHSDSGSDHDVYNWLGFGACTGNTINNDNLRVDVESDGNAQDVDSYKQGEINVGYGPCHENSENPASDVSDHSNDNGARYHNWAGARC